VITDPALIRRWFPYLGDQPVAVLHARRCGWLDAPALGQYLLERAVANGARLLTANLAGVELEGGQVRGVRLENGPVARIATERFVNAAGPAFKAEHGAHGLDLPVFCELHMRAGFPGDPASFPGEAPLLIWMDPIELHYSPPERVALEQSAEGRALLGRFPAGLHLRPAGTAAEPYGLGLWTFDMTPREPQLPPATDARHGEITLRGLANVLPGLRGLVDRGVRPQVDAGYYTKTAENRPLIGPTPVAGAYLMGALSGFGVMGACAFGELLAAHVVGAPLPPYAQALQLSRYDDPAYRQLLGHWGSSGQL
jgi:glycine/D-amino acid oxidase-like deaminating enzyme